MEGDTRAAMGNTYAAISIHALRVEGDQAWRDKYGDNSDISIHALRVEGDLELGETIRDHGFISIHALRVEGDDRCP